MAAPPYPAWEDLCYRLSFNSNNFAISAALADIIRSNECNFFRKHSGVHRISLLRKCDETA